MDSIDENGTPRFAIVVRGYDRMQVDDYVGSLHQWTEQADHRAQQCEAALARAQAEAEQLRRRLASVDAGALTATPESVKALGDRVGSIMQSSFHTAEELRRRAEDAARAMTAEAEETATQVVDAATRRAQELSKAAEDLLMQAQEAMAGAEAAVARQVEEARRLATAEREELLRQARAQAKELAERTKAEETVRREQLAALEDHRRRVMEEISLLHDRLGNIGEGLSPSPSGGGTVRVAAPEVPPELPPSQDGAAEPEHADETLMLELPPARRDARRRVSSSKR